MSSMLNLFYI